MLPSGGRTAEGSKWKRLEMDALSGTRRREVPKVRAAPNSECPLSIPEIWRHPCRHQWCAVKTTQAAGFTCRVGRAEEAFSGQVINKDKCARRRLESAGG